MGWARRQMASNTGPAECIDGICIYIRYAPAPETIPITSIQSFRNFSNLSLICARKDNASREKNNKFSCFIPRRSLSSTHFNALKILFISDLRFNLATQMHI